MPTQKTLGPFDPVQNSTTGGVLTGQASPDKLRFGSIRFDIQRRAVPSGSILGRMGQKRHYRLSLGSKQGFPVEYKYKGDEQMN